MSNSVSSSGAVYEATAPSIAASSIAAAVEQARAELASGDPAAEFAAHVRPGDVVLDVRSRRGELCIALAARGDAQLVIGIETDIGAVEAARRALAGRAARTSELMRVRFARADLRDLGHDLEAEERYVRENPVTDAESLMDFRAWCATQRERAPTIVPSSCDLVLAQSLLHLPRRDDRLRALQQMFWATKPGGRLVLNEVVSDEPIAPRLEGDRELWSSGLIGSLTEAGLAAALTQLGYVSVHYSRWQTRPWRIVAGIEFRAVTVEAIKPSGRECVDRGDAVIYRGPFAEISDDEGHVFVRGERMAVCERTFAFLTQGPHRDHFVAVPGRAGRDAVPWCAPAGTKRPARESKSEAPPASCVPGSDCC
jgi:arsenite methyltransferase